MRTSLAKKKQFWLYLASSQEEAVLVVSSQLGSARKPLLGSLNYSAHPLIEKSNH